MFNYIVGVASRASFSCCKTLEGYSDLASLPLKKNCIRQFVNKV